MSRVRTVVVCLVVGVWLLGVLLSIVDGQTLLQVTTPLMTVVLGFLFTDHATRAA